MAVILKCGFLSDINIAIMIKSVLIYTTLPLRRHKK